MVRKRRGEEETFKRRMTPKRYRSRQNTKSVIDKIRDDWNKITEGWVGAIVYVLLGVVLALITRQVLSVGLSTEMPVVAVISDSMQHDKVEVSHYTWLADSLGYDEDYISSWPVSDGLMIGDMPIVKGEERYEIGDVIVYSVADQQWPTIHRIIKTNKDGSYQTKGDNNLDQIHYEFSVTDEKIFGKVIFVIPKLGYFKIIFTRMMGGT